MRHKYVVGSLGPYMRLFSNVELSEIDIEKYLSDLGFNEINKEETRDDSGKLRPIKTYDVNGINYSYIICIEPIPNTAFTFKIDKFFYYLPKQDYVIYTLSEKNEYNFEKMKILIFQILKGLYHDKESSSERIVDFEDKKNEWEVLALLMKFNYNGRNYDYLFSVLKLYILNGFKSSTRENLYKKQ